MKDRPYITQQRISFCGCVPSSKKVLTSLQNKLIFLLASNFTFSLAQWARPEEYHLPTKYKKSKLQVGLARGKQTLRPTYPKDKPEFYLFSIPGIPNTCKHD